MRYTRTLQMGLVMSFATACGTTESVGVGGVSASFDGRLQASLQPPVASAGDENLSLVMDVRSALPEDASAGLCASVVEARPAASLAWSDVTSSTAVCTRQLVVLSPASSAQFLGIASRARLRQVGGGVMGAGLRVRVRHTLTGSRGVYLVQSAELALSAP